MAEWATAIGTWLLVAATTALVYVAWRELLEINKNQKEANDNHRRWATLNACDRYDTDRLIQQAVRALKAAPRGLDDQMKRLYATRLLNYFDSIAIGLEQNFYVEAIARPHIGRIIFRRFAELTNAENPWISHEEAQRDFKTLIRLMKTWEDIE